MKLKCKLCNDIIESMYRHDFKYCKCKTICVDGGNDYLRYGGDFNAILFDYNNNWVTYDELNNINNKNENNN